MRSLNRLKIGICGSFFIAVFILLVKLMFLNTFNLFHLLFFFVLVILFASLFYLSYYDFKKMEVHNLVSLILMLFLFILNLTLFFVLGSDNGLSITSRFEYIPYGNLLGALVLGAIFQLVVLITQEKALGLGDVRIAIIVGLLVGFSNLWLWLNITIFSALFYGLLIARKRKKFKGLKIPLVPFMVLGIVAVLLLTL
jgi:prepilin signal peptidase PulO-like enzyme (type II secretory pathway)